MQVDVLTLANSAELRDGLLYLLGGGWTRCWPDAGRSYPLDRAIVAAAAIRVEYGETNEEHKFRLEVRDSDETILGPDQVEGGFTMGRDAHLTAGMSQLVQLAGSLSVKLPSAGVYSVVLSVDGREQKRIAFEALEQRPG